MAEPISIQQLKDASEDAISLAEFINKPENVMIPRRLASDIHSLQYYLEYMESFAQRSYETYDEMVANASNLSENVSAFVTNDSDTSKNGIYTYNGTDFVKGDYQPENAAKDFVENKLGGLEVFDGKVRAQDVSTEDGDTQASKNTEFRNGLDAIPFEDGVLADTFLVTTKNGKGMVTRNQHEKNAEQLTVFDFGASGIAAVKSIADWTIIGSNPYYTDLAAIQVDYPHAVSLDDTTDWVAIQAAIDYMASKGGGDVVLPNKKYRTNRPIDMKPFVSLTGESPTTSISKISDTPNAAGKNVIIYGNNYRQAKISNLQLIGNRTNYADGNVVTMDGVYFTSANYCEFTHVRIASCKVGWHFQSSWLINMSSTVSVRCQDYGVKLTGANTSFTILNHTNWGTGGGYYIASAQYTTIICPANDHIDYGGLPNDPFLPEGSGGNHLQPKHLYYIIGSQVTILSGGMENSATQFMYCEGSNVSINNPAVYTTVGHSTDYKFMQVRGTGKSTLNIVGADRLFKATLAPSLSAGLGRSMIYVERAGAARQIVSSDSLPSSAGSFGRYTIYQVNKNHESSPSIISPIKDYKVELNQSNMQVGDTTPFISEGVDNIANITVVEGKKILTLSGDGSTHKIPLRASGGMFMLDCLASVIAAGQYVTIQVVDSEGAIIKQWQNNVSVIDVRYDTFYTDNPLPLFLEFKPKNGQSIKFERLELQQVG